MRLLIEEAVSDKYPSLKLGVVVARGLRASKKNIEMDQMIRLIEEKSRLAFEKKSHLRMHPHVSSMHKLFQSLGIDSKKISIEKQIERIIEGGVLTRNNTVLDICLAVGVYHLIPILSYDLGKISGDLYLRLGVSGDSFHLDDSSSQEKISPDELVVSDSSRILTRVWHHRTFSEVTISTSTEDIVAILVAPTPVHTAEIVTTAAEELAESVSMLFEAKTISHVIFSPETGYELNS
jgi:DNA/RNA-binding domain of Phe-tRNA-synthetase-like protein